MTRIKTLQEYSFNTENNTYVIAEIGINHGGDIKTAFKLIDSAARTGCDAVKFQTYLTEKRAPKGNQTIFDILKKCELPFEAFGELKQYAQNKEIDFFSTPFDRESVDYLRSIDTDLYKVASFDVVNHALLRDVAATGKPVILSVGMAGLDEIQDAYKILKKGTENIAILHCISSYPLAEDQANLSAIHELREAFDCIIGYSDHTPGIMVPLYAVAVGAQIIEKHYKVDEDMDCIDASVSISEDQMRDMVEKIRGLETMFGDGFLGVRRTEEPIVAFRRPTA